jgi:hypothetical protein
MQCTHHKQYYRSSPAFNAVGPAIIINLCCQFFANTLRNKDAIVALIRSGGGFTYKGKFLRTCPNGRVRYWPETHPIGSSLNCGRCGAQGSSFWDQDNMSDASRKWRIENRRATIFSNMAPLVGAAFVINFVVTVYYAMMVGLLHDVGHRALAVLTIQGAEFFSPTTESFSASSGYPRLLACRRRYALWPRRSLSGALRRSKSGCGGF